MQILRYHTKNYAHPNIAFPSPLSELSASNLANKPERTDNLKEVLSRTFSQEQPITFPVVDNAVALIVTLYQCKFLEPAMDTNDRGTMYKMVHRLLHYFRLHAVSMWN